MVNDDNGWEVERGDGKQIRGTENIDKILPVGDGVDRRRFLQATGAGVAATSLAGCTGSSSDEGGGVGDTVKIGVLAPEPENNPIGASIANSAELAAAELNADDGIAGADVEVIVKDTKEDPSTGKTKYQELTVGESVDLTTGVFTSEVMINLMSSVAEQQTVHLNAGSATPETTKKVAEDYEKFKYYFRTGPVNSHYLGTNMIDFAEAKFEDMGWDSVAVLAEDFKWTEPISAALEGALSDVGVDVPINKRYASGTSNFSPIYDEVENADVDAVYVVMAHTGTAAVVQWAKEQRPFEFGGIHVPLQFPTYYKATKGAAGYTVTQTTATPTSNLTEKTGPYAEAYKEENGQYPVYTGYSTYDAVKQYAAVVEDVGTTDADEVVSGLEDSSFTGTTTDALEYYGQDHEYPHDVKYGPEKAWPVWLQWQTENDTGKQKAIWPDDVAETEYEKPPWV